MDRAIIAQLVVGELASIVFSNLSLFHNSIGMYQIYKLLNIPLMCLLENLWFGRCTCRAAADSIVELKEMLSICSALLECYARTWIYLDLPSPPVSTLLRGGSAP